MKPGQYRCGDCRQIHQGTPDPTWKCCPTCKEAFLRRYAEIAKAQQDNKPTQERLPL